MTIQGILFDLDGTLLDRPASLTRFLTSQHLRLIAPVSDCPLEPYQTCSSNWINTVAYGKTSSTNNSSPFQLDVTRLFCSRLFDRFRQNKCPVSGNDFLVESSVVHLPSRSDHERPERFATFRHRTLIDLRPFLIRF